MYEIEQDFLEEALELIQECEDVLLEYERDPSLYKSTVEVLYRCFHSLKGASSMYSLKEHEEVFHQLEDLLSKQGDLDNPLLLEYFLDNIENLRNLFRKGKNKIKPFNEEFTSQPKVTKNLKKDESSPKKVDKPDFILEKKSVAKMMLAYVGVDHCGVAQTLSHFESLGYETRCYSNLGSLFSDDSKHCCLVMMDLDQGDGEDEALSAIKEVRRHFLLTPIIVLCDDREQKKHSLKIFNAGANHIHYRSDDQEILKKYCHDYSGKFHFERLFGKAMRHLLRQFGDLDVLLRRQGRQIQAESYRNEIQELKSDMNKIKSKLF